MKVEITVFVDVDEDSGRQSVTIGFPKEQIPINVRDATHMLISAASLFIKSCNKVDVGIKDYELMKEVYKHLEQEFSSTTAFDDAYVNEEKLKIKS